MQVRLPRLQSKALPQGPQGNPSQTAPGVLSTDPAQTAPIFLASQQPLLSKKEQHPSFLLEKFLGCFRGGISISQPCQCPRCLQGAGAGNVSGLIGSPTLDR